MYKCVRHSNTKTFFFHSRQQSYASLQENLYKVQSIMSQVQVQEMMQPVDTLQLQNGQFVPCVSNLSTEAEEIPIIDVSRMFSERLEDRQAVAELIREACHRIGFFYVINHVSFFQRLNDGQRFVYFI